MLAHAWRYSLSFLHSSLLPTMPNLADKLAKQFRVISGALIFVETAVAISLLFFAPLEANVFLFLFILGASISISGWASYGTHRKNPRLMRMYIGSNLGCFVSIVLSVVALAIILFAAAQSGEHDMMDLQTASGEALFRPALHLYPAAPQIDLPNRPDMEIAPENDVVPLDVVPLNNAAPLNDGIVHGIPVPHPEAPQLAATETLTLISETLGHAHGHGTHSAASCAAFGFAILAMVLGWFCLKVVSMVLAWRLTKLWAGRRCVTQCPKSRQMAPMPKAAYAPTPYFIVVPQGQSAYVAPKAQQV